MFALAFQQLILLLSAAMQRLHMPSDAAGRLMCLLTSLLLPATFSPEAFIDVPEYSSLTWKMLVPSCILTLRPLYHLLPTPIPFHLLPILTLHPIPPMPTLLHQLPGETLLPLRPTPTPEPLPSLSIRTSLLVLPSLSPFTPIQLPGTR